MFICLYRQTNEITWKYEFICDRKCLKVHCCVVWYRFRHQKRSLCEAQQSSFSPTVVVQQHWVFCLCFSLPLVKYHSLIITNKTKSNACKWSNEATMIVWRNANKNYQRRELTFVSLIVLFCTFITSIIFKSVIYLYSYNEIARVCWEGLWNTDTQVPRSHYKKDQTLYLSQETENGCVGPAVI